MPQRHAKDWIKDINKRDDCIVKTSICAEPKSYKPKRRHRTSWMVGTNTAGGERERRLTLIRVSLTQQQRGLGEAPRQTEHG